MRREAISRRGFAISPQNGKRNTQTGRLSQNTLLHKRYMIMRTIGHGGMAAVYQAQDSKHNTLCAIKEMSFSTVPTNEQKQAVQNFLAEATILSRLNHPNLPVFTDFFTEGERHFLVMEYVEGNTLEELLEMNGGPFSEQRVLGWARQLCDVLEYLHSQQPPVIFRDMKPGNIMLRKKDGRVKLIDFGIARFFKRSGGQDTDTQLLGTPGFAPPEQYGTAQTDERSDLYSLAMTLFQLMTDTLPDKSFGLSDIRAVNPRISVPVARALEKATDPDVNARYESIAVFRRALLGVGTFIFEDGHEATTPEELAELCARYPEEAADYLFAGEIESWLQEIGANDLARTTKRIRATVGDPQIGVDKFLKAVMGPSAQARSLRGGTNGTGTGARLPVPPSTSAVGKTGKAARKSPPAVIVRPTSIDFGEVYRGLSAPMLLSISGEQGASVRGAISPVESWIIVDQTSFDAMSTLVRVRVDSTRLSVSKHYEGTIRVKPAGMAPEREITVKVMLDVIDADVTVSQRSTGGTLLSGNQDATLAGSGMVMSPANRSQTQTALPYEDAQDIADRMKYGRPGDIPRGWSPSPPSPRLRLWLRRGLIFFTAFMAASFFYTFLAHLPPLANTSILPRHSWFILVALGMIPLATLGALLATFEDTWSSWSTWSSKDTINRMCTGLAMALITVGLSEFLWQNLIREAGALQLFMLLLITALGASLGTTFRVSNWILKWVIWAMDRVRSLTIGAAVILGGCLGFALTVGVDFDWFTPSGILLGIAVAVTLILRVDHLIRHP